MNESTAILSYWSSTKNISFSILSIVPLIFIYEIMCIIQFFHSPIYFRNGADVIIRQLFNIFGSYSEILYGMLLIITIFIVIYYNMNILKKEIVKSRYLFFMIIESIIWSIAIIIILLFIDNVLLSIMNRNILPQQFYLAIGAGIWEEFLFRFIILSTLLILFNKILSFKKINSLLLAIIISSVIFSGFHYIGDYADIFTYKSFLSRSMGGLLIGTLYIIRGFGIVVYTHIFYDMALISIPILTK